MRIRDILKQELIGLEVEVVSATNKDLEGIKGTIVGETKNTLIIERDKKIKKILKEQCALSVKLDKKDVQVDGKLLLGRSEDRVKK